MGAVELYLLTHVPAALLALLFALVAIGVAVGGLALVRRRFPHERLSAHNDTAGVLIAIVGGLYGVLLAFIVAIAWQQFEDASGIADEEALLVTLLYREAGRFPAHTDELRADVDIYAQAVVEDEWTEMAAQRGDADTVDRSLNVIEGAVVRMEPSTPAQVALYQEFVRRLSELEKTRRERLSAGSTRLPMPLWWVLVVGGFITVGFTYFFGLASWRAHAVMVGAIAATIGLTLFLIVSLELPFTGDLAVAPDALREAISEFAEIRAG